MLGTVYTNIWMSCCRHMVQMCQCHKGKSQFLPINHCFINEKNEIKMKIIENPDKKKQPMKIIQ